MFTWLPISVNLPQATIFRSSQLDNFGTVSCKLLSLLARSLRNLRRAQEETGIGQVLFVTFSIKEHRAGLTSRASRQVSTRHAEACATVPQITWASRGSGRRDWRLPAS